MLFPEKRLVSLAVALANTARQAKPRTKRQKREGKIPPGKTWADMMALSNEFIGPRNICGFVTYPSVAQAKKVEMWMRRVVTNKPGRLSEVLDRYVAKIELRPVLTFKNGHLEFVPTMFRASPLALAALGVALLMDPERDWISRFGNCKGCKKYFLDLRKGKGPKRKVWCGDKCEDAYKYKTKLSRPKSMQAVEIPPSIPPTVG